MSDIYHVWCDLRPGMKDWEFTDAVASWLGHLRDQGAIDEFRLTRRKLGLAPDHLGEFHIMIETRDLAQLDQAFRIAAARDEPAELLHHCVNHMVCNSRFALYRDFPDPVRQRGQERF